VPQAAVAGQAEEVELEFSELPNIEPPKSDLPQTSAAIPAEELRLNVDAQLATSQQSVNATLTSALAATQNSVGQIGGIGAEGKGVGTGEALSKLGAKFFGSYAEGERFVYVLDSSKSMTGDRWFYACRELLESVSALQPHQQFFVICFDEKATCMFSMPASRIKYFQNDDETRRHLKRWLLARPLGRATLPATAVMMALKMKPDAIFLLSDGEIQDNTVWQLRTVNGFFSEHQVPVHTIHLMSLEGRGTLQLIANENSGTFTPVLGAGGF
jgi:hypothetical protein